jgi:glycosyltransferase involved in cell wall biosynthesis
VADVYAAYLHPNEVTASFHKSLWGLKEYDEANSHRIGGWAAVRSSGYGIPEARNTVIDYFLSTDAEWLFFIDADMGFEPQALDHLLHYADQERPVVGGLCFAYQEQGFDGLSGIRSKPMPTIYEWAGDGQFQGRAHYPVNSLVQTASTGFALVVIHRTVLEAVAEKYGPNWCDRIPKEKQKIGDGPLGEDMSFFTRVGSLGIPVHVHTGIRTSHQKTIFVQEADFWESFIAPPATQPVDVIVPTVKPRTEKLPGLAASLKASTGLARLILVLDDGEHRAELENAGVDTADSIITPGRFPVKVNAGYEASTADWIQVVGDDCVFHPGWLDHQQWVADRYGAKVVGSNDQANPRVLRGEHATHWMIARDYIETSGASWDGPGVVTHEGYKHWFCDDEIVVKARSEGVFQPALGAVIAHHHPITGLAEEDEVYRKNDQYADRDRKRFEKRVREHVDA